MAITLYVFLGRCHMSIAFLIAVNQMQKQKERRKA